MKITEQKAQALKRGEILRDSGLMAIGRQGPTTWAYQGDLRRDGEFIRSVRVTLGRQGEMSLKEARAAAGEIRMKLRQGIDPNQRTKPAQQLTLVEVLDDHINQRSLADRTVEEYCRHFNDVSLDTLYGFRNRQARHITRDEVRDLRARLVKRSESLCSAALKILRLTLEHAKRLDPELLDNPVQAVVIPVVPRANEKPVTVSEFTRLVLALPDRQRALWTSCLLLGVRPGSLLRVQDGDIDTDLRTIHFRHVKHRQEGATLPIGKRLADVLARYQSQPRVGDLLWPGTQMRKPTRCWPYTAKQLRHNFTQLAFRADVPWAEQRMLMLHSLPGIGAVYTHPEALVEHLRQYTQAVENLVSEEAPGLLPEI